MNFNFLYTNRRRIIDESQNNEKDYNALLNYWRHLRRRDNHCFDRKRIIMDLKMMKPSRRVCC